MIQATANVERPDGQPGHEIPFSSQAQLADAFKLGIVLSQWRKINETLGADGEFGWNNLLILLILGVKSCAGTQWNSTGRLQNKEN